MQNIVHFPGAFNNSVQAIFLYIGYRLQGIFLSAEVRYGYFMRLVDSTSKVRVICYTKAQKGKEMSDTPAIKCDKCGHVGCTVEEIVQKPAPISMSDYASENATEYSAWQATEYGVYATTRWFNITCNHCGYTLEYAKYARLPRVQFKEGVDY